MVSEHRSWKNPLHKHSSQEKGKTTLFSYKKNKAFIEKYFQPQNHLEKCALTQGIFWHLQHTFSVGRSPGKWNPSFHKVRENQKTRVPEVPENQKHQSRNPQIRFEGVKIGFLKFRLHQLTRLSLAHLSLGSEFQNSKFEKLGFPHKTLSCSFRTSCSCSISCSCSRKISCNHPWIFLKSW